MYLDHIYPPTLPSFSLVTPQHLPKPSTFTSFSFLKITHSILLAADMNMDKLPAAVPLEKNDSSSPCSHQPSIASHLGVGFMRALPTSLLEFQLSWSFAGLVRGSNNCWEFMNSVVIPWPEDSILQPFLLTPWLVGSIFSSLTFPGLVGINIDVSSRAKHLTVILRMLTSHESLHRDCYPL